MKILSLHYRKPEPSQVRRHLGPMSLGIRHLNTSQEPEQHSAKVFRQLMVYASLPGRISKLGNIPSFSWFLKKYIAFECHIPYSSDNVVAL